MALRRSASNRIHTASKAPWYEITDTLPQFAEFPREEFWAKYE